MNRDVVTFVSRLALKFLGAAHPLRLGGGCLLGVIAYFLAGLCSNLFPEYPLILEIYSMGPIAFIVMGAGIFFAPLIFYRPYLSQKHRELFSILDEIMQRGGISKQKRAELYSELAQKIVSGYKVDETPNLNVDKLLEDAIVTDEESQG